MSGRCATARAAGTAAKRSTARPMPKTSRPRCGGASSSARSPTSTRRRPARGLRRRVVSAPREAETRALDAQPLQPGMGQARAAMARRLSAQGADPEVVSESGQAHRQGRRRRDDPQAMFTLQSVMGLAVLHGRIATNSVKAVRKPCQRSRQVRPLAPVTVETIRVSARPPGRHARFRARLRRSAARRGAWPAVAERPRAHDSRRPVRVAGPREGHQDERHSHGPAATGAQR